MGAVGIIAEFNPLHSGHEYLLNKARLIAGKDPVVVIMSGNYVQRGEMAIMEKWQRAKTAIAEGADLVLEMPFSTTLQAADKFALGSVFALEKVGVDRLVFGVEDENLDFEFLGEKIAELPQRPDLFEDYTQTFSTQYNQMVAREVGFEVSQPNGILGLAYAVANYQLLSPMKMIPIGRIGAKHDSPLALTNAVQSASAIRNQLLQGEAVNLADWLPAQEAAWLSEQKLYPNWNLLFPFLKYRIESASLAELRQIYQMSEGLEYKFKAEIHLSRNFTEFLRRVKSKRYTYSRLRRLALFTLLNVTTDDMFKSFDQEMLLILGTSKVGRKYLKSLRKTSKIPLISKVDQKNSKDGSLSLNVKVDRLFEQIMAVDQNFGRHANQL
ncbi:MAG: nucleotidyltransferase [Lactobacillus sp.]|nr:nucleotidyltransferase [Lactobacillus sp.]